ncbi:IPT/TIG domain-containing protein [Streptomyces sp. NPDC052036]|uniref:IPT/TIG domain-containing protein n=1 Tax=Streptomyces sp. NPDC052036 TaxID=3155171 RepID=UPI0034164F6D
MTLTTPAGTSNAIPFRYSGPPFPCSLSGASGPLAGGDVITLYGTELSTATSVRFGTQTAVPTAITDRQISVTVPAGAAAGTVVVSVTTAGGTSNPATYTYVAPPPPPASPPRSAHLPAVPSSPSRGRISPAPR